MIPFEFWTDEAGWPADGPGYVFLARAIRLLLQAAYGEQWTEHAEFERPSDPPLFNPEWMTSEQRARVRDFVTQKFPGYAWEGEPTAGNWQMARSVIDAYRRKLWPVSPEFSEVCHTIKLMALYRELETATQAPQGGPFTPLQWHAWNSKKTTDRFLFCGLDPNDPFNEPMQQHPDATMVQHWLFVEADSLARLIARVRDGEPLVKSAPADSENDSGSDGRKLALAKVEFKKIYPDGIPLGTSKKEAFNALNKKLGPNDIGERSFRRMLNGR